MTTPKKRPRGRPKGTHAPPKYTRRLASVGLTEAQRAALDTTLSRVGESEADFVREAIGVQVGDEWPRETRKRK